jgi:hypothetical protein
MIFLLAVSCANGKITYKENPAVVTPTTTCTSDKTVEVSTQSFVRTMEVEVSKEGDIKMEHKAMSFNFANALSVIAGYVIGLF